MCFPRKPEIVYVPQPVDQAPVTVDPVDSNAGTNTNTNTNTNTGTDTSTNTGTDTNVNAGSGTSTTTVTNPDGSQTVEVAPPPPAPPAKDPVMASSNYYAASTNQINPVMQNVYDPTNPESGFNMEKGAILKRAKGTSQLRIDLDPVIANMSKDSGLQITK